MNPKKNIINLDSMYTPYTLDTYNVFDLSQSMDQELENIKEDHPELTQEQINNIDFTFKNKEYLQALADARLYLLKENIIDDVILSINEDGKPESPKEYNFKTDTAYNNYIVNIEALNAYIEANKEDYKINKIQDGPGFWWLGDEDQTKLHYYLANESVKKYDNKEAYYYDMVETVPAYEYIEYTTPLERLEYLRQEIEAGRISYGEIAELQSLAEYIDKEDKLLLEWAGVPEFTE